MTILSALKKLHKKMTGQETTSKTIGGVLDSMQENYTGGSGGGGDTYETVAEMQLGEPISGEGIPEWATAFDVSNYETEIRSLTDDRSSIYISSDSYKSGEKIELAYEDETWIKNCTVSQEGLTWDNPINDCFLLSEAGFMFGSNVDFSNTTVKIFKKVSGGGSITVDSEIIENGTNPVTGRAIHTALASKADVVNAPLIVSGSLIQNTNPEFTAQYEFKTEEMQISDIADAIAAGRVVMFKGTQAGSVDVWFTVSGKPVSQQLFNAYGIIFDTGTTVLSMNTYSETFIGVNVLFRIPSYNSSDAGRVLSVNNNGELEWVMST